MSRRQKIAFIANFYDLEPGVIEFEKFPEKRIDQILDLIVSSSERKCPSLNLAHFDLFRVFLN